MKISAWHKSIGEFQFYLSSIKSQLEQKNALKSHMFQFYLSSIKSPGRLPQEGVDDGFNSTLVQLKVEHS